MRLLVLFLCCVCYVICVPTNCGNNERITFEDTNCTESSNSSTLESESRLNSSNPAPQLPLATLPSIQHEQHKSRAFNLTTSNKTKGLDDLSLDDIPVVMPTMQTHDTSSPPPSTTVPTTTNSTMCQEADGRTFKPGQMFNRGCDEVCECLGSKALCKPRCSVPLHKKGFARNDPFCTEVPSEDECCVLLKCTQDTEMEPLEGCVHKNQTFHRGEMFNDGCESVCSCGDKGKVACKSRCAQVANNTSDRCVTIPDPADPCCFVVVCDVTLGEQDVNKIGAEEVMLHNAELQLASADALNNTSAIIHFQGEPELESNLTAEISFDQKVWNTTALDLVVIHNLQPGRTYYIRVKSGGLTSNAVHVTLPTDTSILGSLPQNATNTTAERNVTHIGDDYICNYKKHNYTLGQEFNDECESFCICTETGVDCSKIECPTDFGLDVLDPSCLKWETKPRDFVAKPPTCCPQKVRCLDNGSCKMKGQIIQNWAEVPIELSGCEKKCYCELGNISCHEICPPVTATPPQTLPCRPQEAYLDYMPGEDCCRYWVCPDLFSVFNNQGQIPPGFPNHPNLHHPHQSNNGVQVQVVEPVDDHTIRLAFSVPQILVGLHGRVEVRYTANKHEQDPSTWELQILAPPDDLIATPQLHFELGNLLPDTTYSIFIKVILKDLANAPQSEILTVRTLPLSTPQTTLPPQIMVDPELISSDANSTWAKLTWRKFTDFELQFIDGVQLRYRELDGKVFAATPLIHRSVTSYVIEDLKPNTQYEVGLFFIPFPGQTTELQSERLIHITTSLENDPYKFEIQLDIISKKSTSVEVTWSGVPYPEDKYVNIYRVIYQSEAGKEDFNTFKVAKRDATPKILIAKLKQGTRYRLWLEAYLTNGRIKKSNVHDFLTKAGTVAASVQGELSGTPPTVEPSDYYGPLVAVAILAALAIMAALILLLVLMRKHSQNKAAISTIRKTQSAYDNPSYKTCENDNQNNGVSNGNGVSRNNATVEACT